MSAVQLTELGKQTIRVIDARNAWMTLRNNRPETFDDIWVEWDYDSKEREAFNKFLNEREVEHKIETAMDEALATPKVVVSFAKSAPKNFVIASFYTSQWKAA